MKVHLPIVGKASGSSAGLIYQSYYGNTYTRSFPFLFHYPDTAKQQKCQASFFAIQRAWWPIFYKMRDYVSKSQRHNTNIFNKLSKGLFKSIMTYSEKSERNKTMSWGLDTRRSVTFVPDNLKLSIDREVCYVDTTISGLLCKRKFIPNYYHLLLYNVTQQMFYYIVEQYTDPKISSSFLLTAKWEDSDLILLYVALSSNDFFSNFHLSVQ